MKGYNKVVVMGLVGRDPELKASTSGTEICSFSVATESGFGDKAKTQWHNIVCFGKTATTAAQYLKKGSNVLIEGSIEYQEFIAKDGTKKSKTQIICNQLAFVGGKSDSAEQVAKPIEPQFDDDIPF